MTYATVVYFRVLIGFFLLCAKVFVSTFVILEVGLIHCYST